MYRPQRGACLHPPHRLAEGSGLSGAHNTEKRMELPNWAAFSSHTFFTEHQSDFVERETAQGSETRLACF